MCLSMYTSSLQLTEDSALCWIYCSGGLFEEHSIVIYFIKAILL